MNLMSGRRRRRLTTVAALATAGVLAAAGPAIARPSHTTPGDDGTITVVSGRPDQVTGEDARVRVRVPDPYRSPR